MRRLKFLLCGLLLVSCAGVHQPEHRPIKLIVVHSNDIHGRSWPFSLGDERKVGGYAAQASLVKRIRDEAARENAAFLLFSGGDVNTGVPESDFSQAKPDFQAMKAIGYDAMVVGNHDFDHGAELLLKQLSWVNFPFLGANVRLKKTGNYFSQASAIFNRRGIKIGVVGITTDEMPKLILPDYSKALLIEDGIKAAIRETTQLKKEGAQILVALSHLGLSGTGSSQYTVISNDDRKLAREVPELDLIVGGHSHTDLPEGVREGKTLIVQSGYRGVRIGRVDLLWDPEKSEVISSKAQLIPVDPSQGEDAEIKKLVDPYREKFEKEMGVVLFETKQALIGQRSESPSLELSLGNFVCDALRKETKSDLAFFNSGGIRSSIPKGQVKKRNILESFPFRNKVSVGVLSGAEVISLLTDGSQEAMIGGGVLQVSGLKYQIENGKITNVVTSSGPIELKRNYSFATNSFVSAGGDKLKTMLRARSLKNLQLNVDDVLIQYGRKLKVVDVQNEGRINLIKE
jgi:5'-nucleotidase/UDP-sugar diphosphatase